MPHIVLHHLKRSRSHRIIWLLEELELPFDIKEYDRDAKTSRAPKSLKEVHPLGRAPAVEIDGVVYVESGAIIETVLDIKGGRLRPEPNTEAHRQFRFFMHYAEGSLMPPLLVSLITGKVRSAKLPFGIKQIAHKIVGEIDKSYTAGEIENHRQFLEAHLENREYVAGASLSAADIQMSYPIEALLSRGSGGMPNLRAYLDRIQARPAYQRALKKGGPVML